MAETIDTKTLARIKKLHAMAESAREVGSLAEADSFMDAVQKTLAAHNMDMSMLNVELKDLTDPMENAYEFATHEEFRRNCEAWGKILATAVAEAHYCSVLFGSKSNAVYFYGRQSNLNTTRKMFTYLRDMALRLGREAYYKEAIRRKRLHGTEKGCFQYRLTWFESFAIEVQERYTAMRQRVDADTGMKLVLNTVSAEARAAARKDAMTPEEMKKSRSNQTRRADFIDPLGALHGTQAARNVNLQPNVLDMNSDDRKRLT